MNRLCITTLVDLRYWDYVELFTWCAKKSYPEYDVKILKKEEYFPGYPDRGYTTNALRMVTGIKPYEGYDFIYITDIDIMILRESPTLLDFHIADLTGPFSNSIRGKSNIFTFGSEQWDGSQCLSGLHFCTPEWFQRIEPIAEQYRELLKTSEVGRGYDGRMLYQMCREAGLPIPPKKKLIKRHHGIHIGTFRLWKEGLLHINRPGATPMSKEQADRAADKRVSDKKVQTWKAYMADPEYQRIVSRMTNPEVIRHVKQLEDYARLH